jgi:thioredoxin reductase
MKTEDEVVNTMERHAWTVVGGGLHGCCIAHLLCRRTVHTTDEVRTIDPHDRLLARFERRARACRMNTLRSAHVHHLADDPFSLRSYAQGQDREGQLHETHRYVTRPSLDLFLDHAHHTLRRSGVTDTHVQGSVIGIEATSDGYRVETTAGDFETERVLLALGSGPQRTPTWARGLPETVACWHVWDDERPDVDRLAAGHTTVVGGSITAGQVTTGLAEAGGDVTMLTRSAIETANSEADPQWINWDSIERELHALPPGSEERYVRVRAARNDGTMPPYLRRRLDEACEATGVRCEHGTVESATVDGEGLTLRLGDGTAVETDHVILATGLESPTDHPLVTRVGEALGLERGYRGYPVLDDETLAWQRTDGSLSNVYVSGQLAELTAGPLARNIIGARKFAERLFGRTSNRRSVSLPSN